ncbi:HAMP domain-containing sensor histidine kinase [Dawidia soli]|uniref:histidine kinase n=1 Tax=Dawidia soli TaxID=2782352 RepID=A0AAP2GGS8_9BACT|nr:HAMP domain-containing sensor histidine kinase [Dawidia soli]MBT1686436.1 HAMP domain-containing histidine kinase [Dawidia soli]
MKIRSRLTLTFLLIVTVILLVVTVSIYFFFDNFRHEDFHRRLRRRALSTAGLLMHRGEEGVKLLRLMEDGNPADLPGQHILVFNDRYELVYNSRPKATFDLDSSLLRKITADSDLRYSSGEQDVIGILSASASGKFYVLAAARDVFGREALISLFDILVFVFLVSIGFVLLLGWIYAGKVLRPITRVIHDVENMSGADLSYRLNEGKQQDEIDKLSQTFNRMLDRLRDSFISQRTFISNASHELRTPIAVISAEIETALMQTGEDDKNYEILTSVLASSKRLSALSSQLLLLAQATARQSNRGFTATRVDQALWDAKMDLDKANTGYDIVIDFDINLQEEELSVNGDGALLKVVFLNLMDNACKYSPDRRVAVRLGRSTESLSIAFENKGVISPEDLDRILAPFFRGSNSKAIRGNGIGLSLANEIIKLHGGALSVHSVGAMTTFVVKFPDM